MAKIIFFGTSDFAIPILENLIDEGHEVAIVVTVPDKPAGRKQMLASSPIKLAAQKLNLEIWQPKNFKIENFNLFESWKLKIKNCDLGVVSAYGKIISPEIFNLPKWGTVVVHPSILPHHRGPSPVQGAILGGEKITGVTIMKMDEELDHGDIISSDTYKIFPDDGFLKINQEIWELGAKLLIKTIPDYISGKIKPMPQDHSKATFTKKLTVQDGEIKDEDTTETFVRKVRALNPEPGTFLILKKAGKEIRIKILEVDNSNKSKIPNQEAEILPPKSLFSIDGKLAIKLQDGYVIIRTIQPSGKKPMSGEDFIRGHRELLK